MVGDGSGDFIAHLRDLARESRIEGRFHILRPVPPAEVIPLARTADVGMAIHSNNGLSRQFALPNKLFEYLAAGVPVVTSDFPAMADLVKEHDVGATCDSSDPASIGQAIRDVTHSPPRHQALRHNAATASLTLNWDVEGPKLLALIDGLTSSPSARSVRADDAYATWLANPSPIRLARSIATASSAGHSSGSCLQALPNYSSLTGCSCGAWPGRRCRRASPAPSSALAGRLSRLASFWRSTRRSISRSLRPKFQHCASSAYVVFILAGLMPYLATAEALSLGIGSVVTNKSVLNNTVFPIDLAPVKAVILAQASMVVGMTAAIIGVIVTHKISPLIVFFPFVWLLQILALIGATWILSLLNVMIRDLQYVLNAVLMILLIASPIFYTPTQVPHGLTLILALNPLAYFITAYQEIIVLGYAPSLGHVVGLVVISLGLFCGGSIFFARTKKVLIDYV